MRQLPGESEKHFAAEVVRLAKTRRHAVYFTQRSMGSPPGWPDLVLVKPPHMRFRELKTDTGQLTPTQAECIELLRACGADVDVWRPRDWPRIAEELSA